MLPIIDGHNDTLLHLHDPRRGAGEDFLTGPTSGHLDLLRARAGGLAGGFFAIFVPPDPALPEPPNQGAIFTADGYEVPLPPAIDPGYAQRETIAMMAELFQLEARSGGQLKVVRAVDELVAALDAGVLGVILHVEGAEALDPDLDALEVFYRAGLRSLGPVWSRPNLFGQGVPFRYPGSPDGGPGLSEAGRALVRACNRLGIMLDLSHLNEPGFRDVAALSDVPLVVSHAGAHALCPIPRNLTDAELDAVGDSDGVVGIVFEVGMLRADGRFDVDTPLDEIARHVDYVANRIGIDHVAFGSDFDGTDALPRELGDVSGFPRLIEVLRRRGYDDAALRKLSSENWLRVLRRTWKDG